MEIELTRGCVCDYLGIDGIKEIEMTDEQRKEYFDKIVKKLPTLDSGWFNFFLQWICQEFGDYECADKPCPTCGDYIETYKVNL